MKTVGRISKHTYVFPIPQACRLVFGKYSLAIFLRRDNHPIVIISQLQDKRVTEVTCIIAFISRFDNPIIILFPVHAILAESAQHHFLTGVVPGIVHHVFLTGLIIYHAAGAKRRIIRACRAETKNRFSVFHLFI